MFAPKVAKSVESRAGKLAPYRSTLGARSFGGGTIQQPHAIQRSIGNQAAFRLLAQRTSTPVGNHLGGRNERQADAASSTGQQAVPGPSWCFADIPIFSATRANAGLPFAGGRSPLAPRLASLVTDSAAACTDGIDLEGTSQQLTDQVSRVDAGTPPPAAGTPPPAAGTPPPAAGTRAAVTNVTFGTVNFSTTPTGMSARIPPRIPQLIAVSISGTGSVAISVDGASATNGTATVNGAATASLAASGNVTLQGNAQTAPGSAGNLRLVAKVGPTTVGTSNAFTICAIPTTVTISGGTPITGTERGVDVPTSNNSDSGKIADLDQVQMSEKVQYVNGRGCFAGITSGDNSGFLPANVAPHGTDHHGTPVSLITGAGSIDAQQMFVFDDARSGATNTSVTNSGFNIHREVTATTTDAGTSLSITTSKSGVATKVRGTSANAGSGSATSGAQAV